MTATQLQALRHPALRISLVVGTMTQCNRWRNEKKAVIIEPPTDNSANLIGEINNGDGVNSDLWQRCHHEICVCQQGAGQLVIGFLRNDH